MLSLTTHPIGLLVTATLIQIGAAILAWLVLPLISPGTWLQLPQIFLLLTFVQAGLAALFSKLFRHPPWWIWIHFLLPISIWAAYQLAFPNSVYLVAFTLSLLVYWNTLRTRVPLYLSTHETCQSLASELPLNTLLADLGSGTGRVLYRLAQLRPDCQFVGYETAPIPYWLSLWRCRAYPNIRIYRRAFENSDLSAYPYIYVFLSPQPMPALWEKLTAEKRMTQYLISNSFVIPHTRPHKIIQVDDRRQTQLLFYLI